MIEEGTTNDLTPASLCLPEKFRGPFPEWMLLKWGWSYPARLKLREGRKQAGRPYSNISGG